MGDGNGFDQWGGYMDAKISKLEEQYDQASAQYRKSRLFGGVSIFVNGLTKPTASELKVLMMEYGGTYHHYERTTTSYIIASNLPDVKVRQAKGNTKIIKPDWVVDCIKANRLLDYTPYMLLTNQKTSQPAIKFKTLGAGPIKVHSTNDFPTETVEEANGIGDWRTSKTSELIISDVRSNVRDPELTDTFNATMNKSSSHAGQRGSALTAVDPDFLAEFQQNSRLHHISNMKTSFQHLIRDKRAVGMLSFEHLDALKNDFERRGMITEEQLHTNYIMHIDMDCFFVSVALLKYPHCRGRPAIVTHSKGGESAKNVPVHPQADRATERDLFVRKFQDMDNSLLATKVNEGFDAHMSLSEIASCSYEARECGIRNGMFVGQALKLCPDLVVLPYCFKEYEEVATKMYNTVSQYTLDIEPVSCDEMYVNLDGILKYLRVPPMHFVTALRKEIFRLTGCNCSAGVGDNKLQARLATMAAKPNNQFLLKPSKVEEYMADLSVEDLPGVGQSSAAILHRSDIRTCGDMRNHSMESLQKLMGSKLGEKLYMFCRGQDNRQLEYDHERKSVSVEVNYGIRFTTPEQALKFLTQMCEEVQKRLLMEKRLCKSVCLKIMRRAPDAPVETSKFLGHGVCTVINKTKTLSECTDNINHIQGAVFSLFASLKVPPHELRGIGIQLTKLTPITGSVKERSTLLNMFTKVAQKKKDEEALFKKQPMQQPEDSSSLAKPAKQSAIDTLMQARTAIKRAADSIPQAKPAKQRAADSSPTTKLQINEILKALDIEYLASWSLTLQKTAVISLIDMATKPFGEQYQSTSDKLKLFRKLLDLLVQSEIETMDSRMLSDSKLPEPFFDPSGHADQTSTGSVSKIAIRTLNHVDDNIILDSGSESHSAEPVFDPSGHADQTITESEATEEVLTPIRDVDSKSWYIKTEFELPEPFFDSSCTAYQNSLLGDNFKELLNDWMARSDISQLSDSDYMLSNIMYLIDGKRLDRLLDVVKHLHRVITDQTYRTEAEKLRYGESGDTRKQDYTNCKWHNVFNNLKEVANAEIQKKSRGYMLRLDLPIQCDRCCQ